LTISGANSVLNSFSASRTAQIIIASNSYVHSLQLTDGASLRVQQNINIFLGSEVGTFVFVGEPAVFNISNGMENMLLTASMQPAVIVDAGATVTIQGNVYINARASILGTIVVQDGKTLSFLEVELSLYHLLVANNPCLGCGAVSSGGDSEHFQLHNGAGWLQLQTRSLRLI